MNNQIENRMNDPDIIQAAKRLRSPLHDVASYAIKFGITNAAALESINQICLIIWGMDFDTFQNRRFNNV